MSFTVTNLTDRINEELQIYGRFQTNTVTNIIKNAVIEYMKKVDRPTISATLAVTADTLRYTIPTTIDQIEDVRDEDGISVVVSRIDTVGSYLHLQDSPSGSVNYTVYGTPKSITTNLDTVVEAIDENDENVVWAYIEAYANKSAQGQDWIALIQGADKVALETLRSRNRSLSMADSSMRFVDTTGAYITDVDNTEGIDPDVSDYLESDY
jgi:hypothetical protein